MCPCTPDPVGCAQLSVHSPLKCRIPYLLARQLLLPRNQRATDARAQADRDATGSVTISSPKGLPVVYTLDGTVPTAKSAVYRSAIALPRGGTVQAACLRPDGGLGILASKDLAGLFPSGWKVVGVESQLDNSPASNAIDGNSATIWETTASANPAASHQITVDMGSVQRIAGFTYLPRQDGVREGIVQSYRFETSADGATWTIDSDSGHFGNVRNNPVVQEVSFAPVDARFFRFTALQTNDGRASAAEVSVLPADGNH